MRYPILIHPNDKLKRTAQPIDVITDETIALLDNLYETMIANRCSSSRTKQENCCDRSR